MKKRGEILIGTVVFIILNVVFISILILFLLQQGNGATTLEQSYAKQIALLIDSSKPVMKIEIDMEKGIKIAEENGIDPNKVVSINGNVVTVKLTQDSGYSYSFFNDVDVGKYPDKNPQTNKLTGRYVFTINEK